MTERGVEPGDQLVQAMCSGDRRALAQVITALEDGRGDIAGIVDALQPHLTGTAVIGFTGPPGAGKSTLVNALIAFWRGRQKRVAVVAVDPSSPVSGGALLGDRIRMTAALDDDDVYVRSLASQGHLGGLSPAAVRVVDAFDAAGFDLVLLETVGTGQNEIDIAAVADVSAIVMAPGLGDGIQAIKSGLLEVADVMIVNKSDRPEARATAQQLEAAISLRDGIGRAPRILQTVATTGNGVADLAGELERLAAAVHAGTTAASRRRRRGRYILERLAIESVRTQLGNDTDATVAAVIEDVLAGRLPANQAVRRLLR